MNQVEISDFLRIALDEGYDVQAILNQVITIRMGEEDARLRNESFLRSWNLTHPNNSA